MGEHEWLTSSDPRAMLDWLTTAHARPGQYGRTVSDRKLRLWACGCVRQVWDRISEVYPKRCIEIAERYADGGRVKTALFDAGQKYRTGNTSVLSKERISLACCLDDALEAAHAVHREHTLLFPDQAEARKIQADLIRCIIGNPYRPATLPKCERCGGDYTMRWIDNADAGICPNCFRGFSCLTPLVASLATVAYDERPGRACERCGGLGAIDEHRRKNARTIGGYYRVACPDCHGTGRVEDGLLDPARLAVLADALEEAGCPTDACEDCGGVRTRAEHTLCAACGGWIMPHPLLAHLRSPGPHVRGCWAVDLCLGKS